MQTDPAKAANVRLFHREIAAPHADGYTRNAPLLVAIEATTRCNLKCVHCTNAFSKEAPVDLSLELFRSVVPLVKTAYEVYLFGDGEVTLNVPRHLAMIAGIRAQDSTCDLGFSTNGKLLTPEVYDLYSASGVQYIQLSVDAGSKELYEQMRRGGRWEGLISNLEGIMALRRRSKTPQPQLRLATVISRQNYRELPLLAEFAKRFEFSYWYINAEYFHNPGRDTFRLTAQDLVELERMRELIVEKYGSSYTTLFDPSIGLEAATGDVWLSKSPVYCTIPWQHFEMKANGDVKVCPYFHDPICSMQGRSFADVWNGDEFRHVRRALASGTALPRYCVGCKFGMRWQYLPGHPGLPLTGRAEWSSLGRRAVRKAGRILSLSAGALAARRPKHPDAV